MLSMDLTRSLPSRIHARQDHVRAACNAILGSDHNWKSFSFYLTLQKLTVTANATGLVGHDLGTDPRWLRAVQWYTVALAIGAYVSHSVPRPLRPVAALFAFLPAWAVYWYMAMLLRPKLARDIREHQAAAEKGQLQDLLQPSPDKSFPITAWMISRTHPKQPTLSELTSRFIVASFEATASSAVTICSVITELATRPWLVEELREEISEVLKKDGQLPKTNLSELEKLDSVMKESARMNPFMYLALIRRVQKPVQLSIGPELPAGSTLCVDAYHCYNSKKTWKHPEEFDPMRFYNLRRQPGQEMKHQFVGTGHDSPQWGDGPQACPGRFFATNTLKILLVHLLMKYDFQFPPGAGKPHRIIFPNGSTTPELTARIQFRRRQE
ncbi:hypothetical protein DL768_010386 [Monosporascus sp. mg162]|nr:hypothetical protein DL768_010386 [Monosporascus sp. mg162]